jgi:hypothetical protein
VGGAYSRGGAYYRRKGYTIGRIYFKEKRYIALNKKYFSVHPDKEIKEIIDKLGGFKKVFICQIGHHLFHITTRDILQEMANIYNDSKEKEYIEKHYNSDYIKIIKPCNRLSEIFALAFYDFCENNLDKDNKLFDLIESIGDLK